MVYNLHKFFEKKLFLHLTFKGVSLKILLQNKPRNICTKLHVSSPLLSIIRFFQLTIAVMHILKQSVQKMPFVLSCISRRKINYTAIQKLHQTIYRVIQQKMKKIQGWKDQIVQKGMRIFQIYKGLIIKNLLTRQMHQLQRNFTQQLEKESSKNQFLKITFL